MGNRRQREAQQEARRLLEKAAAEGRLPQEQLLSELSIFAGDAARRATTDPRRQSELRSAMVREMTSVKGDFKELLRAGRADETVDAPVPFSRSIQFSKLPFRTCNPLNRMIPLQFATGRLGPGNTRAARGDDKAFHEGHDLYGEIGDDCLAVFTGKVVAVNQNHHEYGKMVTLCADNTWNGKPCYVLYAHLNSINVTLSENVKCGQLIGTLGATGSARQLQHLHIQFGEAMYNDYDQPGIYGKPFRLWSPNWLYTDVKYYPFIGKIDGYREGVYQIRNDQVYFPDYYAPIVTLKLTPLNAIDCWLQEGGVWDTNYLFEPKKSRLLTSFSNQSKSPPSEVETIRILRNGFKSKSSDSPSESIVNNATYHLNYFKL